MTERVGQFRQIPILMGFGMRSIPDRATGVSVVASSSANTYGSWVQVTAGEEYDLFIHGIMLGFNVASDFAVDELYAQFQFGIGPSANEVPIGTLKLYSTDFTSAAGSLNTEPFWLPLPILIPEATRVSCRWAHDAASNADTWGVSLLISRVTDEERLA